MNRRELIKQVAILTGSAVVGAELFLTGCTNERKTKTGLTPSDLDLLDEVGETIIPATTTPGAKAIRIGEFMRLIVTDCYTETQQATFIQGIADLESACENMHGKSFMQCNGSQRKELLVGLEKEAKKYNSVSKIINKAVDLIDEIGQPQGPSYNEGSPIHYYTMMKQLTLLGFFTSETGMTETLRHVPVPGRYDGEFPYTSGDKAWAE